MPADSSCIAKNNEGFKQGPISSYGNASLQHRGREPHLDLGHKETIGKGTFSWKASGSIDIFIERVFVLKKI